MKKYLFVYDENIEKMLNFIIAKRAIKKEIKPEKIAELLRNLIKEEYENTQ